MSAALVEVRAGDAVPDWHQQFLAQVLPAVQASARRRFRTLPVADREESTAEAIAGALVAFVRLSKRGKDPTAFAGRLALVAVLKVLAGRLTGSSDNCDDVTSRYCRQRRKGFQIESLDAAPNRNRDGWRALAVEDRRSGPAEIAALRVDFATWLARLSERRRSIVESLAAGNLPKEVATHFNLTRGRVSQLRAALLKSWCDFQSDAPRTTAERRPVAA